MRISPVRRLTYEPLAGVAMLAAVRLDLFTVLDRSTMTAEELGKKLEVASVEKLEGLLYALAHAELLEVEDGRFRCPDDVRNSLSRKGDKYNEGLLTYCETLWNGVRTMPDVIRTGQPQSTRAVENMSAEDAKSFLRALIPLSRDFARTLVQHADLSQHRTMADVAGGAGGLAIELTERYPELSATIYELPEVAKYTRALLEEQNATDRIDVVAADMVDGEPTGEYDVIVSRALLQVISKEMGQKALVNMGRMLRPGGELYICNAMRDDSRLSPSTSVYLNLFLMSAFSSGQAYPEGEYRSWLDTAGFEVRDVHRLPSGHAIIAAVKR